MLSPCWALTRANGKRRTKKPGECETKYLALLSCCPSLKLCSGLGVLDVNKLGPSKNLCLRIIFCVYDVQCHHRFMKPLLSVGAPNILPPVATIMLGAEIVGI